MFPTRFYSAEQPKPSRPSSPISVWDLALQILLQDEWDTVTCINLLCRSRCSLSGLFPSQLLLKIQVSYEMQQPVSLNSSSIQPFYKWLRGIYSFHWVYVHTVWDKKLWGTNKDLHWDKNPHVLLRRPQTGDECVLEDKYLSISVSVSQANNVSLLSTV